MPDLRNVLPVLIGVSLISPDTNAEPAFRGLEILETLSVSLRDDFPEFEQLEVALDRLNASEAFLKYGEPWHLEIYISPEYQLGNRQEDRGTSKGRTPHYFDDPIHEGQIEIGANIVRDFLRPEAEAAKERQSLKKDRERIAINRAGLFDERLSVALEAYISKTKASILIPILEDEIARRNERAKQIADRVTRGDALPVYRDEAELDSAILKHEVVILTEKLKRAERALALLIHEETPLSFTPDLDNFEPVKRLNVDQLLLLAKSRNRERLALESRYEVARQDDLPDPDGVPRIRLLVGTAGFYRERSFADEDREDWIGEISSGIEVEIPLWGAGRKAAIQRTRQLAAEEDRLAIEAWDREQRLRILKSYEQLCATAEVVPLAHEKHRIAKERARISRVQLETEGGMAGSIREREVEEDFQEVYKCKKEAAEAEVDLYDSYLSLGLLVGTGDSSI